MHRNTLDRAAGLRKCQPETSPPLAGSRQKFEATSRLIRDLIAHRWVRTRRVRERTAPKRIHYLSMEFLLGRTLRNNIMNLAAEPLVQHARSSARQTAFQAPAVLGSRQARSNGSRQVCGAMS